MPATTDLRPGSGIPVATLPGVGTRTVAALARLGIGTVDDLLWHLPFRYELVSAEATVDDIVQSASEGDTLTVRGEVAAVRTIPGRGAGRTRVEATMAGRAGSVRLVWFNAPWVARKLHPGQSGRAIGKCSRFNGYLQLTNPQWVPMAREEGEQPLGDATVRCIYPTTEDVPQQRFGTLIAPLLADLPRLVVDWLPEGDRAHQGLPPLAEAMRMVHAPANVAEADHGRRRLAFDELYLLQAALALRRWQVRHSGGAIQVPASAAVDQAIRARLPFALTPDQETVVREIATDLDSTVPMNRLLQGDVGSGKTAVAIYALLSAVAAGAQGALVAPTEILAEQHARSCRALLRGASMEWALLTGSTGGAERRRIVAGLEDGSISLVVGTHAVLSEGIAFKRLALAVIDEQHRFGVTQRASLRAKGTSGSLHTLVMTATPIPRTLAMTFFGDLDCSTIRRPPPGRKPVVTRVVGFDKRDDVYRYVRGRLDRGEQCYVVVPAVEESDAGLADVAGTAEELAGGHFRGVSIGRVHGRMGAAERDAAMTAFRDGTTQVLVATVVIEVGVDVPNASLMVIEHAERFGLAQLHQLRGRVGRGTAESLCVYIGDPTTESATQRLQVIGGSTDGFRIAEEDLRIRGPGDFFGEAQSGLPPFHAADLLRDGMLSELARRAASDRVARSPQLQGPDESLLRRAVLSQYGAALGLSDVG